jgi:sugar lactone lactonase YvrE
VDVFDERRCRLGESPYYDQRSGRSYWVDILGARLLWRDEDGAAGELPTGAHVGAAVPTDDDQVVLCLPAGPVLVSTDGVHIRPLGTSVEAGAAAGVESANHPMRSNDAKADQAGRLWLGTMAYDETPGAGALYRLDPGDRLPQRVRGNVSVSNGIAWSPDNRTMYYVDSPTPTYRCISLQPRHGDVRATARVRRHRPGLPGRAVCRRRGWSVGGFVGRRGDPALPRQRRG